MRVVKNESEFENSYNSAQAESKISFITPAEAAKKRLEEAGAEVELK